MSKVARALNESLTSRMIVGLMLVVALSTIFWLMEFTREKKALEEHLILTARAINHSVRQEIVGVQRYVEVLSVTINAAVLNNDMSIAQDLSKRTLASHEFISHVLLTSESGQQVFNTLVEFGKPLPITKNLTRITEVFASAKPRLSNLVIGTISRKSEILVDVPIFRDGRVIYVLTAVMNSDAFRRVLSVQQFPSEWIGK